MRPVGMALSVIGRLCGMGEFKVSSEREKDRWMMDTVTVKMMNGHVAD